jgi:hypothetical protein
VYVKWVARHHRRKPLNLVASYRDERGRPKQRYLAYLGSYDAAELHDDDARRRYWEFIDAKLQSLALPLDEYAKIVSTIERRLPRPKRQMVRPEKVASVMVR